MSMGRAVGGAVIALAVALLIADLVLFEYFGPFIVLPIAVSPFAVVGALLVARVPRNVVGWLLFASGLFFEVSFASGAYAWTALVREPGRLPFGVIAALLSSATFAPGLGVAVLMLLFFPSGRGLGGRWTWLERLFVLFVLTIGVTAFLNDAPIDVSSPLTLAAQSRSTIPNPLALHGLAGDIVNALSHLSDSSSIPLVLFAPLSLVVRYRRSTAIEREQIKWLLYSGTLALVLLVLSNFAPQSIGNLLWASAMVALGAVPVSIAIAIFRYRLYDIDILIRRTLVYGALSAVLLAAYVGAVALLETVLTPVTSGSGAAVAISTLAVVALFQPLRTRIQAAVDRRFYRANYDAERTLDMFAERLRDEIDLRALERELVAVVGEALRPASASLWLRQGRR